MVALRADTLTLTHRLMRVLINCSVFLFLNGCHSSNHEAEMVQWQGPTMGTQWQISIGTESVPAMRSRPDLREQIESELIRINTLMSTWDPGSELSRFNAAQTREPIELHSDTLRVLAEAQRVASATDGAYDVTRGTVFSLWGFGADDAHPSAPSDEALVAALARSGWQSIHAGEGTVRKGHPSLTIDLSSLAKGFAVDQLGQILESHGLNDYSVNIGGEIRTRGERSENTPWRIGIERPDNSVTTGLELNNAHLASSGSYRNVRLIDGERVSHLIDGRSGVPVRHNLVAVTVLHQSTLLADAWATAFMIIGADDARRYLEDKDLAVQLTLLDTIEADTTDVQGPEQPTFSVWQSPKWATYTMVTLD